MLAMFRRRLATWRRLGVRRGTAVAFGLALAQARARVRAARLWLRPLRVGSADLRQALGGRDPVALLRGTVREAMPTVAAFERRLTALAEPDRRVLLEAAERAAAHRFDLLGSGPTDLGPHIDWQRDFKSGRRWPLEHISKLVISYPDASDIKVPWELSRFQHLPLLAAAFRLTAERRWLEEIGAQLEDWIAHNPVEFGANWACTMDVAIRGANWLATLLLIAEAAGAESWFEPVLGSLLLHGRFIRSHLEWAETRGNHYLSDIVGLLALSALFAQGAEGREWGRFGAAELARELDHQVRVDGCDHEASIPYHRLVTELFVCGTQAAEVLVSGAVTEHHQERLAAMLSFVADYTRPDSLAPQIGDADDGRYLPLDDYGRSDPRWHLHLFEQAGRRYRAAATPAGYPAGGYWIMRAPDLYVIVRCGDVGVGGQGSHAHNDALSFELVYAGRPIVIDPGSYLYTADPVERNRFRSTGFHSTLAIDGLEQNVLSPTALFAMEDRRRARLLAWEPDPTRPSFTGCHGGYESLPEPATHIRRIELDTVGRMLEITDTVRSEGAHELEWTFPLAPCVAAAGAEGARAQFDGELVVEFDAPQVEFAVADGWMSPSYGRRVPTPFLRGRRRSEPGEDVTRIVLRMR